jgi:hypothetical protein
VGLGTLNNLDMQDKDNKLIWEAFGHYKSMADHERAVDQGRDQDPTTWEKETYEFTVSWPNVHGTSHNRSFDIKASTEPTEEQLMQFVAKKVKEQWGNHGEVMSDGDKELIPDPMAFRISRGAVAYGKDEDRGAIGFKRGGNPLHGG